jgi:hypothetical protein
MKTDYFIITSELISGIGFLSEKETKATAAATNL